MKTHDFSARYRVTKELFSTFSSANCNAIYGQQADEKSTTDFHHYMDSWAPSDSEKSILKRTFCYDFDFLYDLGCNIYLHIFEKNPHIKELFPYLKKYGADFSESHEFRNQGLRFAQVRCFFCS